MIRTHRLVGWALPPTGILIALALVYLIWGSTYLVIGYVVKSLPPLLMTGGRFALGGTLLFTILWWRGDRLPTVLHWRNALIVGPLMGISGAAVAFAEQSVGSGVAALAISAVPLWTVLFASFIERIPTRLEIAGLSLGIAGIVILNSSGELWAQPAGAIALLIGPVSWSFGSILNRHLDKPTGLMNTATLLIFSGGALLLGGLLRGEQIVQTPSTEVVLGWIYLAIFGAIVAFGAYIYLLRHTSPALATSYAYVNPVIAVMLGWAIANESVTPLKLSAGLLIVTAVVLISLGGSKESG